MKIEIRNRFTGKTIFTHTATPNSVKITVEAAVKARADLSWADLSRADLSGANLSGANLSGEKITKSPISIKNLRWRVLITEGYMKIGCQRHIHEEWDKFSDEEISKMSVTALEFWTTWKTPLLSMCKAHKEPT